MKFFKKMFSDLEQIEKFGFPIALLITVYGMFLAIINREYYDSIYTMRNGFVCSLQQLFLFILFIQNAYRCYFFGLKKKRGMIVLVYIGFTLLFLFGFGEKIRWGQFIFNLNLPEMFSQYNTQQQITIHNLKFGHFSVNKVVFGTILGIVAVIYSLVIPYLYYKGHAQTQKLVRTFGLPIPKKTQIYWYLLLVVIALLIPVPKRGEVVQFAGVWTFLMIFSFPSNIKDIEVGESASNP